MGLYDCGEGRYVEAPKWGVRARRGHHEPIISLETFERIQARMKGNAKAPARKDISEDFPLRGFVLGDDCGQPMTSSWSKGRSKHYPYYLCDTKGCESERRSIPRDKVEGSFAEILQSLQPTRQIFALAKAMFKEAWNVRMGEKDKVAKQLRDAEKQIEALLERIVEADNASVIKAYEGKIAKLEREKLLLAEKASRNVPPKGRLEEFIEPALEFLGNPWNLYENGSLAFKRTVLGLAFSEPLRYVLTKIRLSNR